MAKNPSEFLDVWLRGNIRTTVYDDEATAKELAFQCRKKARALGFDEARIANAAGGDLDRFMQDQLNEEVNAAADLLASRDKCD